MKSLMQLLREVLLDRGTWCGVSTDLDYKYVEGRVKHEGISYLTISLPAFAEDLQKGLRTGAVTPVDFVGLHKGDGSRYLPVFLRGFTERVFDASTGLLLDQPDIDCIQAIRQISLLFAKIQLPCTPERERKAMSRYIECEKEVRHADSTRSSEDLAAFERIGRILWGEVFAILDREIEDNRLVPRHGPGFTADRVSGNAKYRDHKWTRRLEQVLPSGEYLLPNWRYWEDLQGYDLLEPRDEIPVRVISVPKTLKTTRIIAMEPVHMQYAQQAISRRCVELLERDDFRFLGLVGFTDQIPNREMARDGSSQGTLATLDLSEASDRVSNQLVRSLVRQWPYLREAIDATRSRKADVPGFGVIRLAKYASMGSALCFPMEAMVFATICIVGIERALSRQLRSKEIKLLASRVRVYGDDIIVPTDMAPSVVETLHSFGMKVNLSKSFWTGKFRESCGKEYYDGHDVSITRVRQMFPAQRTDAREIVSLVSLRNQMYFAGYWGVAKWLDEKLSTEILTRRGKSMYPVVETTSPVLGRHSVLGYSTVMSTIEDTLRLCPELHHPLVRGYVVQTDIPEDRVPLDGIGALLKWFLKQGEQPFADARHLERSGRPVAVDTKLRWATPF